MLKLFDRYNPNLDLCIWVYMPNKRKVNNYIEVVIGKQINCTNNNMWKGDNLEIFNFSDNKSRELHVKTRDFLIEKIIKNLERTHDIPSL